MPQATGEIIVTGDADATYPFERIHKYIQQLIDENLDFITTDRFAELRHGSMSGKHYFGNTILICQQTSRSFTHIKETSDKLIFIR